jgi:signal transduction histidine kinase/ligand-binding sensor domain-containing protein
MAYTTRTLRQILLALAACLLCAHAQAQVYRFKVYDSNAGLPSNSTYAVFQDSRGYVWFATDGGAARYDGLGYTTYSVSQGLADASVRGFVEDAQGALWIYTKGGLSRFDGLRFQNYDRTHGLGGDEVRSGLRTRDGTLWFGTLAGLSRFDGTRFVSYGPEAGLPPAPVWSLHEDREGTLFVGTRGGGLLRRQGELFVPVVGLPDNASVFSMAEDAEGGLWFATDRGLHLRRNGAWSALHREHGLPSEQVSTVRIDSRGRLWVCTFGGGIARREPDGTFKIFDRRHGAPDDYVTAMLEDVEGNLWFGSMWRGAFRLVTERFSLWGEDLGLPDGLIAQVAQDAQGGLWFGAMNGGLARRAPDGTVRRYGAADGLTDDRAWSLLVDSRGRVWVGGLSGVFVLDGARFRHHPLEALGAMDRISALAEDERGWIWLGCGAARSNGVLAWDGERFRRFGPADGLATVQVNSIRRGREGRVWIATEDGLFRFDGRTFTRFGREHGLPTRRVLVSHEDAQSRVWAGTTGGLARLEGDRFRVWRTADGLVNEFVGALLEDGPRLWVGTARGLSIFDSSAFQNFTVHQGLPSHEIVSGSGLRQADGVVWFGTPLGALRYQPVPETMRPQAPRVLLRDVQVGDEVVAKQPRVELAHDHRQVTIGFAGLSFADEDAVRYSSMLQGVDTAWSAPDASRTVRLMNLPPGGYTLLVRGRAGSGPWGEPTRLEILVQPALWQRPAMQVLALGLLAALAYGAWVLRLRHVVEQHRQRIATFRQLLDSIRVINGALELTAVLESIAAEGARLVDGEPGGIGLVKDGRVEFPRMHGAEGWEAVHHEVPLGHGVAGQVAATGRSVLVNDPPPGFVLGYPAPLAERYASGLLDVPILDRQGRVVGVLDVRRPAGRAAFDDDDRKLLESLAHQAAVAVENAALYGTLEEKKVMLSESLWAVEQLYRNEQQANRILQELNDMKTSFMIVTSHEMRTPLTIIKGHQEALLGGYLGAVTHTQGATLQICQRNVDRMIGIFDDVIEMMKIDRRAPLRPQPLDLASELGHILQEMSAFIEQRGQVVEVESGSDLPLVVADAGKLQLVFENLLQNAIKFTPDGGRIRVTLRAEDDAVHAVIADEGIGIAQDELERVFDRFYTTRDSLHHGSGTYKFLARGAGLGLAIAKGYVEAHGGRIWAESDGPDRGSRFHVVLPAATATAAADETQALLAAL